MSTFVPGTSGDLKSTTLPNALFEMARILDTAELTRNGALPGLAPKRNLSVSLSFDAGTIAIAATIPITPSIEATGSMQMVAEDYLGSSYTAFIPGTGGQLKSTNLIAAFLEMAQTVAAAEKAITPAENQPNNVQIAFDLETSSATISANLPFTATSSTTGDVNIHAIDYL